MQIPLSTVGLNMRPWYGYLQNIFSIDNILKIHKRTVQIVYDVYDESYFDTSKTPAILGYWSL